MKEVTLFTNYWTQEKDDAVRQWLFDTQGEDEYSSPENVPDHVVLAQLAFNEEIEWEEFYRELEELLEGKKYILARDIGRWNGRHEGYSLITCYRDLCKLWDDCNLLTIKDVNGRLTFEATHHDGTNYGELRELTKKGVELVFGNFYCNYDLKKLFDCNFYTKLPRLAKKLGYQ